MLGATRRTRAHGSAAARQLEGQRTLLCDTCMRSASDDERCMPGLGSALELETSGMLLGMRSSMRSKKTQTVHAVPGSLKLSKSLRTAPKARSRLPCYNPLWAKSGNFSNDRIPRDALGAQTFTKFTRPPDRFCFFASWTMFFHMFFCFVDHIEDRGPTRSPEA